MIINKIMPSREISEALIGIVTETIPGISEQL